MRCSTGYPDDNGSPLREITTIIACLNLKWVNPVRPGTGTFRTQLNRMVINDPPIGRYFVAAMPDDRPTAADVDDFPGGRLTFICNGCAEVYIHHLMVRRPKHARFR